MMVVTLNDCLQLRRSVVIIFCHLLLLITGSVTSAKAQTPSITSFTPATVCQGGIVTISGMDFTGATIVKLGSDNAASFVVDDNTKITAKVSDFATSGLITITTPLGIATSSGALTILSAPRPALTDIGALDAPFTNCDGNATYSLRVSNSSATTGTGNVYQINWGDGSPLFTQTDWPSGAQTNHTYAAQGYFSVSITITPVNGCAKTTIYQFYNGINPLASFTTTNPTTGLCIPANVEFQVGNWFNNSAGTTYRFIFGDGSQNVTFQHPLNASNIVQLLTHTYTTSSCPNVDFTAKLEASNGCFTTTYTLNQIIIRKKPDANFTIGTTSPCIATPICFTNTTINGYTGNSCLTAATYTWDFGDGATSNAMNPPCHSYASGGTYNVTLTTSNTSCGSSTISKPVTVQPASPPPVVSATPAIYCQGQAAAQLTATGTGLLWYTTATGGTGSAIAPTPSTNTPGTTTYYVSQTITNNCESPRVPVTVTVNPSPAAPVTTPVQLCLNQVASPLTATGTALLWYTNATGGTGSPTPPTPSTSAIGTTTWYVSQTVNSCEGPRNSIVVTVNALALAPIVVSPVNYCQNQASIPLTATGTGLLWYTTATGGTGSSTPPTPSTAAVGSTIYYVSQVTGCGEGPRASITVNVNARPSATINYSPAVFCNIGNSASTLVEHTGSLGGTYSVSPVNGLSVNSATGEINPSGATAGTYIIRYTIPGSGGCPDFITTASVTINGTPAATIRYPAICSSDAPAGVILSGTSGGLFTSTTGLAIDPSTGIITPASSTPATYVVTYTISASPPCPGFITTTNVTITQAPAASISYNPAILCNVNNTTTPNPPVSVSQTGTTGGTYSISPANGLSIDPITGQIIPSNATAGTYTIKYTIPGAGGCANYSATTIVTVNGTPMASIIYNGSPFCRGINTARPVSVSGTQGGTFSAAQGLSIDATTGAINPALSTPGTYTVTYTIAASLPCPGYVATTSVQVDDSPVVTFSVPGNSICSGGSAVFIPSSTVPNTTYSWSVVGTLPLNISGISSGIASGTNPVISLSFTNTGTISQTIRIQVIPTNPAQNPCPGAPFILTLIVNPVPQAPVTDTLHFCMGTPPTALNVNALPGTTIHWYDQNFVLLNAAPVISTDIPASFTYYVSQSYSTGCESPKSKMIAIVHPTPKIISSTFTNPNTCGVPSGSIVLNILDLDNNPIPNIPVKVHFDKFQVPFTVSANTDGSGKITIPLTAGMYSGIYVETYGCTSQKIPDVFILKDPNPPAQPVAGYNPPICSESPLILTALSVTSTQAGPIDYVWVGPAFGPFADTVRNTSITFPSAPVSYAGTYIVYAIQNNCISLPTSFPVNIRQSPSKPVIITRTPLCVGDDLFLQAFSSIPGPGADLNYVWKGPGTGFPVNAPSAGINNVKISDAGIYSITVTSPQTGCSSTTDTLIQIGGYPIVKFPQDTLTLPTGYLLHLMPVITNASVPGILPMKKFTWTPSQDISCNDPVCSSPVALIRNNVCYAVKATNIYGCSGSDTICVKVFCRDAQVFIPNAFTPRGGLPENAKFMVRASGIAAVKSFRVFNRWGRVVYERNNFPPNIPDFGWDGRVNGQPADIGVYVYTVEVICENGTSYFFKGNVTLL